MPAWPRATRRFSAKFKPELNEPAGCSSRHDGYPVAPVDVRMECSTRWRLNPVDVRIGSMPVLWIAPGACPTDPETSRRLPGPKLSEQGKLLLLNLNQLLPLLLTKMIKLLVQQHDLQLCFQVDLVVMLRAESILL